MNANQTLLQKKYVRIIELFANENKLTLDAALDFFYHSTLYQLMSEGHSDMHCMSDQYLAQDLKMEFFNKK